MPEETPILKYDNLLVSSRGITETDGSKVILFIPSAEIDRIEVKFGRSDHSPFFSLFIGIIFAIIGVYGLVHLILAPAGYRFELAMIIFGLIGGSIIFDVFKRRYFFEIYRNKGICRLVFSRKARMENIQDFCRQIEGTYKHPISQAHAMHS